LKEAKVLVTGGAGFIGSHLVDILMNEGSSVKVIDNLGTGKYENVRSWLDNSRFEFVNADLKNPEASSENLHDAETVFHLAANSEVRVGETEPTVHFAENLLATFNLLEAMRKNRRSRLLIFASSSTVYGEPHEIPTPEDYGPLLPISIYGASKLGCESLISSYCHTFDFTAVILRFANIVGSRATHGVILDFIRKLQHNSKELEILGDGEQVKSYLHVRDLVRAFLAALRGVDRKRGVEIYNVGSSDQIKVKRIAEIVCQEMAISKPSFRFNNPLKDGRGWKGDVKTMQLAIDKISRLGWQPSLNSEQAVQISCRELL